MGVGCQCHTLDALVLGKRRYPFYRRLGGPQGRSGWVQKISPPTGFSPQTVQSIVSNCIISTLKAYTLTEILNACWWEKYLRNSILLLNCMHGILLCFFVVTFVWNDLYMKHASSLSIIMITLIWLFCWMTVVYFKPQTHRFYKNWGHRQIPSIRKMTRNKFNTEDPQFWSDPWAMLSCGVFCSENLNIYPFFCV
jgi:hypothetical protein